MKTAQTDSPGLVNTLVKEMDAAMSSWHTLNPRRAAYEQFAMRLRSLVISDKTGAESHHLKAWFDEASVVLGLEGDLALRRLEPSKLITDSSLKFEPNAQELYRLQRRILAFFSIDRLVEEREFGVYRQQLTKASDDLHRQLENYVGRAEMVMRAAAALRKSLSTHAGSKPFNEIESCPALLTHDKGREMVAAVVKGDFSKLNLSEEMKKLSGYVWPLDLVRECLQRESESSWPNDAAAVPYTNWLRTCIVQVDKQLEGRHEAERDNSNAALNLGKLHAELSVVQQTARLQEELIGNDELKAAIIDELRRCNSDVIRKWGTWQRRTQRGLTAAFFCAAILCAITWFRAPTLFLIVPFEDWLIASWWEFAVAAVATYILVRIRLQLRVALICRAFAPFDPDRGPDPRMQKTVDARSAASFKGYFTWRRGWTRTWGHRGLQALAILFPAALLGIVTWKASSATEAEVGVLRDSSPGDVCAALIGVPVFSFPTYQVYRTHEKPDVLILHRNTEREGITQAPLEFARCSSVSPVPQVESSSIGGSIEKLAGVISAAGDHQAKAIAESASLESKATMDSGSDQAKAIMEAGRALVAAASDFAKRPVVTDTSNPRDSDDPRTGGELRGKSELSDRDMRAIGKDLAVALGQAMRKSDLSNRMSLDRLVDVLKDGQNSLADSLRGISLEASGLEIALEKINSGLNSQNCVIAESRLAIAGVAIMPGQRDKMYQRFADSCRLQLDAPRGKH